MLPINSIKKWETNQNHLKERIIHFTTTKMEVRKFDEQTPKPQLGNWDMRKRPKLYQSRIQKPHDQTREAIQTNKQKKPIIQILLQNQNPDKKKPIAYPASNRNSQLLFSQHREQNQ